MNVFVTGATGWVGAVVTQDLIAAGHGVLGLCRSAAKADALRTAGAQVVRGTLDDLDLLRDLAARADAVVHCAFDHDFSQFAENARQDRRAIEAIGDALAGSARPLLVTSGLSQLAKGRLATEADVAPAQMLRQSEHAARTLAQRGVRAATVRLAPSVHGVGDHGFIPVLVRLARETGVSAYLGDGLNRWAGVHRLDAGRLYRLALESGLEQSVYHAGADEGVPMRDIAAVIGRRLGLPVEPRDAAHFGWFANFAGADMCATSARTREATGWSPTQPGLLADLDQDAYDAA